MPRSARVKGEKQFERLDENCGCTAVMKVTDSCIEGVEDVCGVICRLPITKACGPVLEGGNKETV